MAKSFKSLLWSNIIAAFAGSSTEALGAAIVNVGLAHSWRVRQLADNMLTGSIFPARARPEDGDIYVGVPIIVLYHR